MRQCSPRRRCREDDSSVAAESEGIATPCETEERLHAVHMLGSLSESPLLQALCDEVRAHFGVGYAGIHLVTDEEMRFEVLSGALEGAEAGISVPRRTTLCGDAVADPGALDEAVLVVLDAEESGKYRDRVMNTGFYASTLIRYAATEGAAGHVVGTLCVHDENPRERFGAEECKKLREYGDKATAILAAPLPSWLGGNVADQPRLQSIEDRLAVLATCTVFKMRVVDRSQMTRIAEKMRPVVVEKGQVVARQGDSCDVIWFVASGSLQCEVDRVEVTRPCGLEPRSQTLGPGACIGELSFVQISELVSSGTSLREARETALRTADVIACEHTELLELSFDDAWTVVQRVPNFFYSLKEVAGLRYRALQRTISPRSYSPVRSARAPTLVHDARRRDSPARGAGHVDASSEQGKQPVAQQPLSTLDEAARIRAVRVLWKLVIPPLQALCDEVQEHFNSQNVGINLVDAEEVRQHWQASSGSTPLTSVKRSYSLCSDAIADPEALAETCGVLVVMDVAKSDKYRDRVMNTGFYASTLIRYAATEGAAGHVVGTLCVHDENPRERFGAEECKKLREYGDKATAILAAPLPSWLGGNVADQPRLQSIEDRLAVLATCTAFKMRVVDRSQMTRIAEKMRPVEVEKGQVVARKGDSCDVIWFVASGSLRCEVDGIELQTLGAGQCIGEMSFISVSMLVSSGTSLREARETALRTADVIPCERTELLEISFDDAWAVVQKVPNLYYTLKEVAEMKKRNSERKIQWAARDAALHDPAESRLGLLGAHSGKS